MIELQLIFSLLSVHSYFYGMQVRGETSHKNHMFS